LNKVRTVDRWLWVKRQQNSITVAKASNTYVGQEKSKGWIRKSLRA